MKIWSVFAASALLLAAIGCGGSGGGGSATGGPNGGGSSAVSLFVTDNMTTGFDHVWVAIQRVEVTGPNGDRVLFDEPGGKSVDLLSLRDARGRRFRLLTSKAIDSGKYTGVRVTVAENARVFPTGSTLGTDATFAGSEGGSKVISSTFPEQTLGARSQLVVDFDLANWNFEGGTITTSNGASLKVVQDTTLGNIDRHDRDDYKGNIGGLAGTAPSQTFNLTLGTSTVVVKTDANTSIFNENGAASPALANGVRVEVYGAFSTADNAVIASSIKIDNENDDDDEVKGKVTSFATDGNSISLDLIRSGGFLPETTAITVQYTDGIRFFGERGTRLTVDQFEAALQNGGFIEAEGTISGNVLTATKLKIEDGDDDGGHHHGGNHDGAAEVKGTTSNANAGAGTFQVAAVEWEGIILANGQSVNVTTSGATEFKVNNSNASAAQFFAALTGTTQVKVEGNYDAETQTLAATEVKIGDNGGGGNGGHGGDDD